MLKGIILLEVLVLALAGAMLLGRRLLQVPQQVALAAESARVDQKAAPSAAITAPASRAESGRQALGSVRQPMLLVEKSRHRLTVFDGGVARKSYRIAIGGGRGDKTCEGDRCTPEGEFYVCVKNPNSRFTLALGLSYPNAEDAARGLRAGRISRAQHDAIVEAIGRRCRPPWNTPLGGEIMIHGKGAGRDWTLGCIAMNDEDIRELYPAVRLGTVVRVVP